MRKYRKYFKLILFPVIFLTLLTYSKSNQSRQTQDIAGISIDPDANGQYWFGLELCETDKENGFTVKSDIISVRAKSVEDAIFYASLQNDYPVRLSHASLVVLNGSLLAKDVQSISSMLLKDWKGQSHGFLAVAEGCRAIDILQHEKNENLRSTQLSDQIDRCVKAGGLNCQTLLQSASRYMDGQTVSLPLIAPDTKGYRVSGSVDIRKAN